MTDFGEQTALFAVGPGKRAAGVAEKLTLDELPREAGEVYGQKRLPAAPRALVQIGRRHFLAGAGLAVKQHRIRGLGAALDHLPQPAHHRAVADKLLARRPLGPHGLRQHRHELIGVEGLEQEGKRPKSHGLDGVRHRAVSGEHDHRALPPRRAAQDLHSGQIGHL